MSNFKQMKCNNSFFLILTIMLFVQYSPAQIIYEMGELENDLAKKFAPILHKHQDDKQVGLANFNDIIEQNSTLKGVSLSGYNVHEDRGYIHAWFREPPIWCSFGHNYNYKINWLLDIDDNVRYKGAIDGNRPLYYHCYKNGNYYYLQYWYFFTMNDISEQTDKNTWHEGDWEHVSLKIENKNGIYTPVKVNFYHHEGGYTVDPSQAWWGTSGGLANYQTMQKGYDEDHTRLHVWIAKNSHASYNRWSDVYNVESPVALEFSETVNYSTLQILFEYDKLVNMGEVYRSPNDYAHNNYWGSHYYQQPDSNDISSAQMDGLAFRGNFGEFWGHSFWIQVPNFDCKKVMTPSPKSPYFGIYHEWTTFSEKAIPGFGNKNTSCLFGLLNGNIFWTEYDILPNMHVDHQIGWHQIFGYEAHDTVYGSNVIEGGYSLVSQEWVGANVIFAAGKSIHLKPGFHAQKGSTFHAYIDENLKE